MIPSLGFDPVAILKGASERLQTYAACGFWALRGLQSTLAAARFLPWLARGSLRELTPGYQCDSSLLSHHLGNGLCSTARNVKHMRCCGGRATITSRLEVLNSEDKQIMVSK